MRRDSAQVRSRAPRALALMETGGSRCESAGESDACVWQPASADQLVAERRWGPVGTPAIRAPRADDPPPGCRCRQWRTMAPEEGRGAAARVNTTCSRSTLNGPPGCRGERGMARAAATLGIIGLRWPPRAPPNMLSFAVVTEWPVGVYPHRRRRSPPHARIVRAVDLPTRVCVPWAK